MYLLRGKPGAVTLLQIVWQCMCILCGWLAQGVPIAPYLFLMLVLNSAGFFLTLLYRRGNVAPKCFLCFLDLVFVLSGLVFGMPLGAAFNCLLLFKNRDIRRLSIIIWGRVAVGLVFSVPILILIFIIRFLSGRNARLTAIARKYGIEEEGLFQGPRSFKYRELSTATKGFSCKELLGTGGFGSVYKGSLVLKGGEEPTQIAVKRIAATSDQGAQEFLAEVKILGQVQHRNLVRVLGWCCEKDELLLVYNYMPNGSVDQYLHKTTKTGEAFLTWARRLSIMNDVATGLAYLHEDWEQRVVHNDVKSSNVMLDCHFNARLGDFGLARLSEHNQVPVSASFIAGTFGYIAPELLNTQRPTEKSDVYSFGAMVLEVATGKKPLLSAKDRRSLNETFLVDWVWRLYENNALLDAVDCRLQNAHDSREMTMFLKMGLLCCHPNPEERPRMREAIHIWKGLIPFPTSSLSKFVPVLGNSIDCLGLDSLEVEDGTQKTLSFITNNSSPQADESWTRSSAMGPRYHSVLAIFSEVYGDSAPPEHH